MKLKIFKKKIETVLFKRNCEEKKIIFYSNVQNNMLSLGSYNILNYSLKHVFQSNLSKFLINNFLKSFFFFNMVDFNSFIKALKKNINLIYFFKIKNLYFFNFSFNFQKKFKIININAFYFIFYLKKIFFCWFLNLKYMVKKFL